MADGSGVMGAAFFIVIFMAVLAPNNEQQIVGAMANCKAIDPEPSELSRCMTYQGFEVAHPGDPVTEVASYVTMYGWEHGWMKRSLDSIRNWFL